MKVIAALLLGLISSVFADTDTDSLVLEFESPDSADVAEGDDAASYGGLIIQVRQGANESPTIALGSDLDDYDDVYCLNFVGFFQASDYDLTTSTSGDYTEIDDTRFDLADANCTTRQEDEGVFTIRCSDIGNATLFLTFSFAQDEQGDFGLEYTITLQDYELSDDATNLVMVQSLDECGDLVDIDPESEDTEDTEDTDTETDDIDDTDDTETDDNDDTIVSEGGRRLLDDNDLISSSTEEPDDGTDLDGELDDEETDEETDTESIDEETDEESLDEADGISEDDSGEFDTGFARFVSNAQALDRCTEGSTTTNTDVESTLVFQEDDDELHIVFGRFQCTLVLDPFYGLDESKYESVYGESATPSPIDDNAHSFTIFIASIIGLVACLW